jgi:hypothetical protein
MQMLIYQQSGVFRPEMLEPMGLPKGVRVLGWGMSLERPTMIKYVLSLPLSVLCSSSGSHILFGFPIRGNLPLVEYRLDARCPAH